MSLEIFLVLGIIIAVIFLRAKYVLISNSSLNELIETYYDQNNFKIIEIRRLSLNERFRYSAWNDVSAFMPYTNSYFRNSKETFFRVIEFSDNDKHEYQVYVEIQILNREITDLIEFDSYEI